MADDERYHLVCEPRVLEAAAVVTRCRPGPAGTADGPAPSETLILSSYSGSLLPLEGADGFGGLRLRERLLLNAAGEPGRLFFVTPDADKFRCAAAGPQGYLYCASRQCVMAVSPDNCVTHIAGRPAPRNSDDGGDGDPGPRPGLDGDDSDDDAPLMYRGRGRGRHQAAADGGLNAGDDDDHALLQRMELLQAQIQVQAQMQAQGQIEAQVQAQAAQVQAEAPAGNGAEARGVGPGPSGAAAGAFFDPMDLSLSDISCLAFAGEYERGSLFMASGWDVYCLRFAASSGPLRPLAQKLPFRMRGCIRGLACDYHGPQGNGRLVIRTRNALYRWPLFTGPVDPGAGANVGAGAANGTAGHPELTLLAGSDDDDEEGEEEGGRSEEEDRTRLTGLALDVEGAAYLSNCNDEDSIVLRRVGLDGSVTTVAASVLDDRPSRTLGFLPNGCLVLASRYRMRVMHLGLRAPPPLAPPREGPRLRTLAADVGSLLSDPQGSDLVVVVGDRRFEVHTLILSARCDYFKHSLAPEWLAAQAANAGPREVTLQDADPAAFELLLRFVYTGRVGIPAALAQPLAELADRLLLPELCRAAQAVVLSGVTLQSVVDLLLWAEQRGEGFSRLLADLKHWYLEHQEEVLQAAEGSVRRLLAASPDLVLSLMAGAARACKRRRTL
ncbi:hypothetical protein HYH03_001991 [Edaphochlamys debaryana]|uniref:BTB domain-containing protein n=1 Tax=Edaphochlamys debaryana TaxID=47281 RepID=A0A835YEW4_9CHLO|nr:hypothetical protein HYH03_001991 [Edaphochlamys debaryana]|eukprot:KAG2500422.1 hypothetical protein HYH03_001991 [Edaphochlamys debaryana]